jgi:hypothetical protein
VIVGDVITIMDTVAGIDETTAWVDWIVGWVVTTLDVQPVKNIDMQISRQTARDNFIRSHLIP